MHTAAVQIKSSQAQWGHTNVEVAFLLHNQKIFPITLIFPIISNVETKFRKKNQNLRIDVRFYRRLFDPNVSSQLTNKHSFVLHNELFD